MGRGLDATQEIVGVEFTGEKTIKHKVETITDKHGVAYKAIKYEGYYSVYVDGAWCAIDTRFIDDPHAYLQIHLFWKK